MTAQERAIEQMTGSALTTHPVDNAAAVLALRSGVPGARAMVLRKRAYWRAYLAASQRRWQRHPRTLARAIGYELHKPGQDPKYAERCAREHLAHREQYVRNG